ncbi:MAG: acyltransferase family protein [Hyphomicrobiales bacterium]
MKYRAEIDGLRALAVVPVILFHAGFELFSGGFVGVDVFFVISGYLITTILITDIENNQFSIFSFYERRARRILPALLFVMLACIPFAWMWMMPSQMKDFSQSFIAVIFFASNILFWIENGYFSAAAEEKPLLHTWSLAVEEQYYVLFPIFLILAWRFGKDRVFWMIATMAAISLLLSEWGWRNDAVANFYLAPTRAWELFAGSITAFVAQKRGVQKNNAVALMGLAAIIYSIFAYDENTPFPSLYALVPVAGVVSFVLYAERETLAARLLSTRAFVGIGLISYSAYLWHQPLFAFARIKSANEPSRLIMIMLVLGSLLLAYLSWKYIETPFRNKAKISSVKIFTFSISGMLALSLFGYLGHLKQGFEFRISYLVENAAEGAKIKEIANQWNFNGYPPHSLIRSSDYNYLAIGDTEIRNDSILLTGDSHAYQYWHSLAEFYSNNLETARSKNLYLANHGLADLSIENVIIPNNTTRVVLSYFWSLQLNNPNVNTFIRCCGSGPGGVVGHKYEKLPPNELESRFIALESFIEALKSRGIDVTLILDNPFGEELNAKSLLGLHRGFSPYLYPIDGALTELARDEANIRREPTHKRLMMLIEKFDLNVIDPFEWLCDIDSCKKFNENLGYLRYKDYDHLSLEAVKNETQYVHQIFD